MRNAKPLPGDIALFQQQVASLSDKLDAEAARRANTESALREVTKQLNEKTGRVNELKERLASSESNVTRLEGYLDRVREDDVVREELIATGDERCGDVRLVPKRKHTPLSRNYDNRISTSQLGYPDEQLYAEARSRPRHWTTY